jgi:AraC-like DNA-binding protein
VRSEFLQKAQAPRLVDFVYPLSFPCGNDEFVRNTIAALWEQQDSHLPYFEQIIELLFQPLMFYIEQRYHDNLEFLATRSSRDRRILEIPSFMMDNYSTITLQSVADEFHYHPAYLIRIFHEQTGNAFSATVKEFWLRQAARLLLESELKLGDICAEVGYNDVTQFIRSFRALFGTTPSQYRKSAK